MNFFNRKQPNAEQAPLKTDVSKNGILAELLNKITEVNFKERLVPGYSGSKKSIEKETIVHVIDEIIDIAQKQNCGLCKMDGSVYAYNGCFWNRIENEEFKFFLGDAACKMGIKRTNAKYFVFQENLFKQFMASAKLNLNSLEKSKTALINLQNGTYEVTGGRHWLRPFSKEDGLTYQLSFPYDEKATAPTFLKYLNRVLPQKDLQNVLSEYIGYVFAKNLKLEKCLLLYGSGANGKSVFFEIINALLGKHNISNCSLGDLSQEHNRAVIAGKLLNYGSELKGEIESDIFKQISSGEPIQSRKKYQNSVFIEDYARLCFNCNELPKGVEHTEAFFRRFLIIPFTVTIPEEERDVDLANKIISSELPGIFNWVLEGLKRILAQRKFSSSETIEQTIVLYKQESDSAFQFLKEYNYEKSSAEWTLMKMLYPEYKQFCINDGYRPLGKVNFGKRLESLGHVTKRHNSGMVVYVQPAK